MTKDEALDSALVKERDDKAGAYEVACRELAALLAERDAALARAEKAEKERDEAEAENAALYSGDIERIKKEWATDVADIVVERDALRALLDEAQAARIRELELEVAEPSWFPAWLDGKNLQIETLVKERDEARGNAAIFRKSMYAVEERATELLVEYEAAISRAKKAETELYSWKTTADHFLDIEREWIDENNRLADEYKKLATLLAEAGEALAPFTTEGIGDSWSGTIETFFDCHDLRRAREVMQKITTFQKETNNA